MLWMCWWPQGSPCWTYAPGTIWPMPNMNDARLQLQLLRNLLVVLGMWPALAFAGTLGGFESISGLAYAITFASSFLGCLAGTLHRMAKHLEPGAPGILHPRLFVASNILGGLSAGWLAFLVSTEVGTSPLLVQGIVLAAAFGGAATVERLTDKLPILKKD